jgi:hypothetical protein
VAADLIDAARWYEAALLARHPEAGEIKDVLRAPIAQRGRVRDAGLNGEGLAIAATS